MFEKRNLKDLIYITLIFYVGWTLVGFGSQVLPIDDRIIDLKEIKEPSGKIKELDKKIFLFYTIKDKEWAEWLSKIFWKMFNSSIDANKRLEEINKII